MVPLRGDLSGDPRFTELLVRTQAEILAVVEHQDYPAALMVRRLVKRDSAQSRLFDIEFVFDAATMDAHGISLTLAQNGARRSLGGLSLETIALPQQAGQFDLSLDLLEVGEKVSGFFMYKTDLFDAATVRRLFGQFKALLEGVLAAPERRLSDFPWLSPAQMHQLLVELPGDLIGTVGDDTVTGVYVVDRKLRPQPLGCYGRVARSGVGAGRGESYGAARTARRFVPNPFAGRPGSRLELTNELGRRLADGLLELLDRGAERSSEEVDRDSEAELGELSDAVLTELGLGAVEVQE
jgi:non-ribosomal peptide synthetase component F